MEANRVFYKNIVDRHECTLRRLTIPVNELLRSILDFLCNNYESERSGKTVYGESVESMSFSIAYI